MQCICACPLWANSGDRDEINFTSRRLNNRLVDLELTREDEANRASMSVRLRHEVRSPRPRRERTWPLLYLLFMLLRTRWVCAR